MEEPTATTRIIPMHINKGKTIAQCMKARIDYVKDPDKTEDGEFISSYACAPESADQEFVLARNQYLMNAGSGKKNEVRLRISSGNLLSRERFRQRKQIRLATSWLSAFFTANTPSLWRHIRIEGMSIIILCSVQRLWTALINSGMCGIPVVLLRRSAMSFAVSIIFLSFRIRRTKPFRMRNGRAINLN